MPEPEGVLREISAGVVALFEEFYGEPPASATSYVLSELAVCVLRGGYSRVEQTLLDGGRARAVIQQRMQFHELMRERFVEVAQRATGREVIACMSGNEQKPNLMCVLFVLAPVCARLPVAGRAAVLNP